MRSTYSIDGKTAREDLDGVCKKLYADETPFLSTIGTGTAKARHVEWTLDDLPAAKHAPKTEGAVAGGDGAAVPNRASNYLQINEESAKVTYRGDRVDQVENARQMAFQKLKQGKIVMIDTEFSALGDQAGDAGAGESSEGADDGTASEMSGLEAWIATNAIHAADGSTAGYNYTTQAMGAVVDGTPEAFTIDKLQTARAMAWAAGGNPRNIFVNSTQKAVLSSQANVAPATNDITSRQSDITLQLAVSSIETDYGTMEIIPCRNMDQDVIFGVDVDYVEMCYLDALQSEDQPFAGLASIAQVWNDKTLKVGNEKAHFKIADLVDTIPTP